MIMTQRTGRWPIGSRASSAIRSAETRRLRAHVEQCRYEWNPGSRCVVIDPMTHFPGAGVEAPEERSAEPPVMDADGSNLRRLTTQTGFQPDWSPDGTRVVFGSGLGREEEIFVMDPDGSDLTRLTYNRFSDVLPGWSPDGSTIAFTSRRHRNTDLYLMAPDGSDQRRLTVSPAKDLNPPGRPTVDGWSSRATVVKGTGTCGRSGATARAWCS